MNAYHLNPLCWKTWSPTSHDLFYKNVSASVKHLSASQSEMTVCAKAYLDNDSAELLNHCKLWLFPYFLNSLLQFVRDTSGCHIFGWSHYIGWLCLWGIQFHSGSISKNCINRVDLCFYTRIFSRFISYIRSKTFLFFFVILHLCCTFCSTVIIHPKRSIK